jgi:hypothetical protein
MRFIFLFFNTAKVQKTNSTKKHFINNTVVFSDIMQSFMIFSN